MRYQRAIGGASLAEIMAKRNQKPEAQREQAISKYNAAVNCKTHYRTPGIVRHGWVIYHTFLTKGTVLEAFGPSQLDE